MVKKTVSKIYTVIMFLFLYSPILCLVVFSFNGAKSNSYWNGFSLRWYKALLTDRTITQALYNSLLIALFSSAFSCVLGTFSALGIHQLGKKMKSFFLTVNSIPVLNPDIVTGISLMAFFIFLKMHLGFSTLLLSHTIFCTPYVILSVLPILRKMPGELTEAALDLGASPAYAFRRVVFPEILPGILTGTLIAFTLSIDDFVISFFTTGNSVSTLPIVVFSMARKGINPKINAISTLMFSVVLMLLLIINRRQRRKH